MSHTALPWEFRRAKRPVDGQFDYAISSTANPGCIAECFGRVGRDRLEDASANAAFIVRAVNCHDELVAALEEVLHGVTVNGWEQRAKSALSKAKATQT